MGLYFRVSPRPELGCWEVMGLGTAEYDKSLKTAKQPGLSFSHEPSVRVGGDKNERMIPGPFNQFPFHSLRTGMSSWRPWEVIAG